LAGEAAELRAELERLVAAVTPWLLELPGVGPISAAQILVCCRTPAGSAVLARLRDDPQTRTYAAWRRSEGKSSRDVRRCLKRAVARQLFKLLERYDHVGVQLISVA
jgi:transposase